MKHLKRTVLFAAAMSLLLLAACGGGNSNTPTPPPTPPVSVTITQTSIFMLVGDSETINVATQNTDFTVVNPPPGSGCVKSGNSVICTPTSAGAYTITVRATAEATKTATAQINVLEEEVEIDESAGEITEIISPQGDMRVPISFTAVDNWTASISGVGVADAVTVFAIEDCDVEPKSGPAGNHTVNVICAPNATSAVRATDLVISSGGGQLLIPITQKPTP